MCQSINQLHSFFFKELAHLIIESENSRFSRADGIRYDPSPSPREEDQYPSWRTIRQRAGILLHSALYSIQVWEGKRLFGVTHSVDSNVSFIQKHPHRYKTHPEIIFKFMGPVKLTHKINHRTHLITLDE